MIRCRLLGRSHPFAQRSAAFLSAIAVSLTVAAAAFATTSNYWGYNYITNSNPASGACYYTTEAGIACANTTADSATVDKLSGDSSDYVWNTFRNAGGDRFNGYITDTISALNATGSDPAEGPTCFHDRVSTGRSYIQCRYTQSGGV